MHSFIFHNMFRPKHVKDKKRVVFVPIKKYVGQQTQRDDDIKIYHNIW